MESPLKQEANQYFGWNPETKGEMHSIRISVSVRDEKQRHEKTCPKSPLKLISEKL